MPWLPWLSRSSGRPARHAAPAAALLVAVASGAQLTDREVSRAIDRADKAERSICVGDTKPGQFNVCVQGPEQRIASAVMAAKAARRALSSAAISEDMRAPTWMVFALPNQPGLVAGRLVRASAETVQLRAGVSADAMVIDPIAVRSTTYSWENPVGATLTARGITATFDPRAIPPGAVEVLVHTEDGMDRRYVLSESARERIR